MRNPNKENVIAVLRRVIGMKVPEFAGLVGRKPSTVQSLECGRLKLSETLAGEISVQTGVSAEWLMTGDASAPIICEGGWGRHKKPYTKEAFEKVRVALAGPFDEFDISCHYDDLIWAVHRVASALAWASHSKDYALERYRIRSALKQLPYSEDFAVFKEALLQPQIYQSSSLGELLLMIGNEFAKSFPKPAPTKKGKSK